MLPSTYAPVQENLQRKQATEVFLQSQGIPVLSSLPVIATSSETRLQDLEAVCMRTLCLIVVALKGEGLEQPIIDQLIESRNLKPHFSPKEAAYLANPSPAQIDSIQFIWRYECAWILMWALGFINQIGRPDKICDAKQVVGLLRDKSTDVFLAEAWLRSASEILDKTDLYYRCHWAVVNARLKNQPAPTGLDSGIVQERHYALNWLIRYLDQDWDLVRTDT